MRLSARPFPPHISREVDARGRQPAREAARSPRCQRCPTASRDDAVIDHRPDHYVRLAAVSERCGCSPPVRLRRHRNRRGSRSTRRLWRWGAVAPRRASAFAVPVALARAQSCQIPQGGSRGRERRRGSRSRAWPPTHATPRRRTTRILGGAAASRRASGFAVLAAPSFCHSSQPARPFEPVVARARVPSGSSSPLSRAVAFGPDHYARLAVVACLIQVLTPGARLLKASGTEEAARPRPRL